LTQTFAPHRFQMALFSAFAGLALVLAAVGIYGVMAQFVAQRTHEIGVRIALGARPRDVLRLVFGEVLRLALLGAALGLAVALGFTRLLRSLLYGISPADPMAFVSVVALLMGVVLFACYVPARRAMRVDPMVALRHEIICPASANRKGWYPYSASLDSSEYPPKRNSRLACRSSRNPFNANIPLGLSRNARATMHLWHRNANFRGR